MTIIKDILNHLFLNMPKKLADNWDNVGLICGDEKKAVKKVLVCLDITFDVIDEAKKNNIDLIVSHHPLFINAIKNITTNSLEGKKLIELIKNDLGAICMHTNFDYANDGVNDVLADTIGLLDKKILKVTHTDTYMKLAVFCPSGYEKDILDEMFEAGAGEIGDYCMCSFSSMGIGTFLPDENADPYIGMPGDLASVGEVKSEVILPKSKKDDVLAAMYNAHPYETPAFDLYEIEYPKVEYGIGRIGELEAEICFDDLLALLKQKLNCNGIRYVKTTDKIKKVAVAGGACAFLTEDVIEGGADVFICGEYKYHDFSDAYQKGMSIIEIGHFASENPSCSKLFDMVKDEFEDVEVVMSQACEDYIRFY